MTEVTEQNDENMRYTFTEANDPQGEHMTTTTSPIELQTIGFNSESPETCFVALRDDNNRMTLFVAFDNYAQAEQMFLTYQHNRVKLFPWLYERADVKCPCTYYGTGTVHIGILGGG